MDENLNKIRHDRSVKDYPKLKLESDEYVELAYLRSKTCLALIWIGILLGILLLVAAFSAMLLSGARLDNIARSFLYIMLFVALLILLITGLVSTYIHRNNKLFVTNKRVIQYVMNSPLSTSYNAIDLSSIEDVSYHQGGVFQKMFSYGTLRLATVGDETTYTARYVQVQPEEINTITKLVSDDKDKVAKN